MTKFYLIIARKIFFPIFIGMGAPATVSYASGREGINLPHGRLKTLAALLDSITVQVFCQILTDFQNFCTVTFEGLPCVSMIRMKQNLLLGDEFHDVFWSILEKFCQQVFHLC